METKMEMHSAKSLRAVHGLSAGAGRPSRRGWLLAGLARLVWAIGAMRRERAYRRGIAELSRLGPRLLADIGLGEAEIYGAVRLGSGEPSPLSRLQRRPHRTTAEPGRLSACRTGAERQPALQRGGRPGDRRPRSLEVRAGAPC
jgi:uncharacterized protein YjiS (DUF1127 family)